MNVDCEGDLGVAVIILEAALDVSPHLDCHRAQMSAMHALEAFENLQAQTFSLGG